MKDGKSTYTWMIVLMISSQLLLAGFVSYWLVNQYQAEQNQLRGELTHALLIAYEEQVDSLLMKHLIAPTLQDSLMLSVNLSDIHSLESGTDSVHTSVVFKHLESDTVPPPEIFAFRIRDSASLEEERMVRSVKLFINKTDEAYRSDARAHAFSMKIDTSTLLHALQDTFQEKGWSFTLNWLPGNAQETSRAEHAGLVLSTGPHTEIPPLLVQQIGPYLLGLMLPQFMFALILMGLSASALILVYRSLKKQLMLNELRNDFIANISHELKTPVSTVKVALEALQLFDLQKDPKVTAEYLEMASRETDRLEDLVGRVLQHQALEDPGALFQIQECDLNPIIASAVKAMNIPIREKEATLKVSGSEVPCMVRADPVYLEGVIINLIDNSLKYAGPRPQIHISVECRNHRKLLKIRDRGPGIPDAYKDQIFHKFFRVPAGDHHNVKGYGLGLNFASQVMNRLGGSISFSNLPDGGCEFVLDFPNP